MTIELTRKPANSTAGGELKDTDASGLISPSGGVKLATTTEPGAVERRQQDVIALGGDFTGSPTMICKRVDNLVTITTALLNHASSDTATSGAGVIPADYRPTLHSNVTHVYYVNSLGPLRVIITDTGEFQVQYFNWTGGALNRTNSASSVTISYLVQ